MLSRVLVFRVLPVAIALALSAAALITSGLASAVEAGPERLPDLDQAAPSGLVITRAGSRSRPVYRLGFRSAVSNVGDGPLIINGHRSGVDQADDDRRPADRARRSAAAGGPRQSASSATPSRPTTATGTCSTSTATSCAAPGAGPRGSATARPASASATATGSPAARFRPRRPDARPSRAAAASTSRTSSASWRGSRSATATTTWPISRASTCR